MIGLNPLLVAYLAVFFVGLVLDLFLTKMNIRHLKSHGHVVPEPFKGYVDRAQLVRISDYTVANQRFDVLASCLGAAVLLIVILSGALPWVVNGIARFNGGLIPSGLLFFALLGGGHTLFTLPFSYYRTFVVENRYGFNTSTRKIWITDLVKSVVVSCVIGGVLLVAVFFLIEHGGHLWWLWAWSVFFAFQLLLLVLYPTIIAPWFNTFVPLDDAALEEKVRAVMEKGGLSVEGIFRMDAGKRSRHTNAYFTGVGKTKRIVLFDTLLAAHDDDEILAILAHEVGHWKRRHVLKTLLLVGCLSFFLFYIVSMCVKWSLLYDAFGFDHQAPYAGLFLFGLLWEAVSLFLSPLGNILSRRHEREADAFAVGLLGKTKDLVKALKKLARDNLSNLFPHPAYAWFHYSHPPLLERIRYLRRYE